MTQSNARLSRVEIVVVAVLVALFIVTPIYMWFASDSDPGSDSDPSPDSSSDITFEIGDCVGNVSLPTDLTDISPGLPEFIGSDPHRVDCADVAAQLEIVNVGGCSSLADYDHDYVDERYGTDEDPVYEMTVEGAGQRFCVKEV